MAAHWGCEVGPGVGRRRRRARVCVCDATSPLRYIAATLQPVLFVHGSWHGAWCWEEHFVPWLRDHGYDARALTLRHHDLRHAPGLRLTRIRDYVADVAAAAAEMPSPPVVVGHSLGGFITQK